ncbi:MAG: bifunctional DNA primase/polymerase [Brevibacterium aurantiacum]|uniref:bifunctional DNA primase/polymerase n=1 Tax=Brevibacterium TaxID=1696 RepID=UPI003F50EC83
MSRRSGFTDAVRRMDASWPLPDAAAAFARAGVPVFPCAPNGKQPITRRGFQDATTDLTQVQVWWSRFPAANIGMPTGAASGVVVVDVDVHGVNGYAAFRRARRAGLVNGWEALVRSPTGGLHIYYPAGDGEQTSWQAGRAGIDFRGDRGYIIVPPSRRLIGGDSVLYRPTRFAPPDGRPLDAGRLRDFLDPKPPPRPRWEGPVASSEAMVGRLASWVARRQEGERNAGLFWAACKLAENGMPRDDAFEVLCAAASQAGLAEREITTTVHSAYRAVATTTTTTPAASGAERGAGSPFGLARPAVRAEPTRGLS